MLLGIENHCEDVSGWCLFFHHFFLNDLLSILLRFIEFYESHSLCALLESVRLPLVVVWPFFSLRHKQYCNALQFLTMRGKIWLIIVNLPFIKIYCTLTLKSAQFHCSWYNDWIFYISLIYLMPMPHKKITTSSIRCHLTEQPLIFKDKPSYSVMNSVLFSIEFFLRS